MHFDPPDGEHDVTILGGGVAGLMCALHLAERGLRPLLLDRADGLGGRVRQHGPVEFQHAGRTFRFSSEHGMHGWWRPYRNFLGVLERHGLSGALIDAWDQAVLFDDGKEVYRTNVGRETQITPVPEPLHHVQLVRKPNIRGLIAARELPQFATLGARVFEAIRFDPTSEHDRERYDRLSVADYTAGVPYFFRAFLKSLCRSAFFSEPEEVSLWAFLIALRLYVFMDRDAQRFAFARGPVMESIFAPLLARMTANGARTVRSCEALSVEREVEPNGGGYRVQWRQTGVPEDEAATGTLRTRGLVVALDVPGAKALLARSPCLAPAYGDLTPFTGRPSTVIRLFWAKAPTTEFAESGVFSGKAVTDNYFWLHRFQDEFRHGWHEAVGGGVSESHIYAPLRLHDLPDDALIARAKRDIERGFPEVAGSLVHAAIVRNPPTHINFPVGCALGFPKVESPFANLALCGDWIEGGVPVLYMERACQTGIAAANHILADRGLPPFPILHPAEPRRHMQVLERLLRLPSDARLAPWLTTATRKGARRGRASRESPPAT